MLHAKLLSKELRAEAVHTAVYTLNRTGRSTVETKTPYELFHGTSFDINNLRIFGTEVFAHIPKQYRAKWDAKGQKGIFVRYSDVTKGYRIYFPGTRKVEILRDVIFINTKRDKQNSENDKVKNDYQIMEIVDENDVIEQAMTLNEEVEDLTEQEEIETSIYKSSDTEEEEKTDTLEGKGKTKKPCWLEDYETNF